MRIAALVLPLALAAAPAFAQPRAGDILGPDKARAQAGLAAQGYRLVEFEAEDGQLEIKAVKAAERLEIRADARTGKVLKVEARKGERE